MFKEFCSFYFPYFIMQFRKIIMLKLNWFRYFLSQFFMVKYFKKVLVTMFNLLISLNWKYTNNKSQTKNYSQTGKTLNTKKNLWIVNELQEKSRSGTWENWTASKNINYFMVLWLVHMLWSLLWLAIIQETLLRYFRCSRFPPHTNYTYF